MAFKRQKRQLIKFEFEFQDINGDTQSLNYEIEHDTDLAKKLTEIGKLDFNTMSSTEAKQALRKAYDTILGFGAMDNIQEKVFGGDELLLTDYLAIGNYLVEEVDKANKELEKLTNTFKFGEKGPALDGIIVDEK
ncbi:hypothetical protein [Anaerococcus tetradius]|uniref:Uncharacterized protein n=1 Tax=Anaerococcus tetradius ATCC 35098 TaxID=525255 RepID=C2CFW8_9FIRM|nr:hypothetical protein [Anaerococcus tetradius]EEI83496.1 hypothetical protein HMPREF0077_0378 [Anaerococcus tetradius ATCC 35098]